MSLHASESRPRRRRRAARVAALALSVALAAGVMAGCGEDDSGGGGGEESQSAPASEAVAQAEEPRRADFPAVQGRTLEELAQTAKPGLEFSPATSVYEAGTNRVAFGLLNSDQELVYGQTAVYVAPRPEQKARGPFLAPSDSLVTDESYRSKTAALEGDIIASIYGTEVEFPKPGQYALLTLTHSGGELIGAPAQVTVKANDPIPSVGERPPAIETETLAHAGGQIEEIDTREPPSDMHEKSFADVVGKQPVALLFATPALCQTRVCGPVVDIAQQLKNEGYGDEVEFIHQEVYANNDVSQGLREPLQAFSLQTEPWLFTFDAEGKVAARLEGSFGFNAFEQALKAAGASAG